MNRALYLMGYTATQAAELEQRYSERCQAAGRPFDLWELEDIARGLKSRDTLSLMRSDALQAQIKAASAKPHSGQKQRPTHPALRRR